MDGQVNSPPPIQVTFYIEDLRIGLRFFISEFVQNFLDIMVFVLLSWLRTLSSWSLVSPCYIVLSRLILTLLYFGFFLFSILTPRPRVGDFWIWERIFLSSPVFHRPFMDRRINFSLLLLHLLGAFLRARAIRELTPTRMVGWILSIEKTCSD